MIAYISYLTMAVVLMLAYMVLYVAITPHKELELIKAGNTAAAAQFSGSLIGFIITLASAISHSVSFIDFVMWGSVATVVQLLAFYGLNLAIPMIANKIETNNVAVGVFAGALSLAVGIINAACMTY